MAEIGSPEAPHLADSADWQLDRCARDAVRLWMHLTKGRSLFAVAQGIENLARIEHSFVAPTFQMHGIVGRVYVAQTGEFHLTGNRRGIAGNRIASGAPGGN